MKTYKLAELIHTFPEHEEVRGMIAYRDEVIVVTTEGVYIASGGETDAVADYPRLRRMYT